MARKTKKTTQAATDKQPAEEKLPPPKRSGLGLFMQEILQQQQAQQQHAPQPEQDEP